MIRWLASLFRRKRPRPAPPDPVAQRYRALKAKYDLAVTDESNRRHWSNADGLSAASANSPEVRRTLRNRSRYEADNGGYCNGIVRTRADDLVGTGPTLQILTDDDALSEAIEQTWAAWARAAGFAEKLHTMDQARDRDGEAFAVLITNRRLDHPVKLDLQPVEADRVADPQGTDFPRAASWDGVDYDPAGNPLRYHVLDEHPGDLLRTYPQAGRWVEAALVLHWFRKDRPGQLRGVPELTSALPLFPYLRRWTLATLAAAETAASFAAMLETEASPDAETVEPTPFETLEIERGMMTTLPAGGKLSQLRAEHPPQAFADFKREVLQECGRPVRMPINVVTADSSRHNFSSAKLDHHGYRGALRVDRHFAEVNLLDKLFREWAAEAVKAGVVPAAVLDLPRAWYWPGWASMDKDEAAQDTERLANGTTTLAELLAEWGLDWKAVVRQRGRELAYQKEQGVPAAGPPPGGPAPPPPPSGDEAEDEDEDEGNEQEVEENAAAQAHHGNGHSRRRF